MKTTVLRGNTYTSYKQGLILVPPDVKTENGQIVIRAKDPGYASPAPDENQKFQVWLNYY